MNIQSTRNIAVIGGGWAGLAAAVELSRQGHRISLFESSPQLGGRARRIHWQGMPLDNGQHLMIGAYRQLLDLLNILNADTDILFQRLPHQMLMLDAQTGQTVFDLQLPRLPAPLHLIIGILKSPSLTMGEKIQVLIRFNRLLNTPLKTDISVSDWLARANLPENYSRKLLLPVSLAALTTHPEQASARAFQAVLQQTFKAPASYTDLLIPRLDLGQVFPTLAEQYILRHGGQIFSRTKVRQLRVSNHRIEALQLKEGIVHFDDYILATPAHISASLLKDIPQTTDLAHQIQQIAFEPVATLYLHFSQPPCLKRPMIGLLNGMGEWVFDRTISGQPDILAVVISAHGDYLRLSGEQLTDHVMTELEHCFGPLPQLLNSKLIIDKRAAFRCHPGVDLLRPGIQTPIGNLKLCGDYVYIEKNNHPGLPSTLEGSLRSGVKCAQLFLSS